MMKRGLRNALIVALAGTLVLAVAGIAGGKIKTQTFSSGDLERAIPDPGTVTQTIEIRKKRSRVKDVNVGLRITHTDVEDLLISVTAPNGKTVDLSSMNGMDFDDD